MIGRVLMARRSPEAAILAAMGKAALTAQEIAAHCGFSYQTVANRCRAMVKAGTLADFEAIVNQRRCVVYRRKSST